MFDGVRWKMPGDYTSMLSVLVLSKLLCVQCHDNDRLRKNRKDLGKSVLVSLGCWWFEFTGQLIKTSSMMSWDPEEPWLLFEPRFHCARLAHITPHNRALFQELLVPPRTAVALPVEHSWATVTGLILPLHQSLLYFFLVFSMQLDEFLHKESEEPLLS